MGKQSRGLRGLLAAVLGHALLAVTASTSAVDLKLADGPAADTPMAAELLGLRQLGAADGLPQLTVFALAQDSSGHVYAGTQDGLARWDGRRFASIALPGDTRDWVTHLWAGADGLWIGTDASGLQLRTATGIHEVPGPGGKPMASIEAITGAARGGVWVGTPGGLFHCSAQSCDSVAQSADLEVAELLEASDGSLWVGTNVDGLYRFSVAADGQLERTGLHLGKAEGLPNNAIRALWIDARERLWIGTGRGMARWDGHTLMRWHQGNDGAPLGGVYRLQALPDGSLLAALWGGGLGHFRMDDGYRVFGLSDGLPDSYLQTLLVSGDASDAIVWLGSGSSGILRLEDGLWRGFDERHGLPQRVVVGVGMLALDDGPEELWAGTLGGAVRWNDGHWIGLLPPAYADYVVYDALRDPRGRVWFGTQRGLLRLAAGRWREYTAEADGLPGASIEHLLWASDRLWVGTNHGLAQIVDEDVGHQFADQAEYAELGISSMAQLDVPSRGLQIALGTPRGLLLTDGATVQTLPPECRRHGQIYDIEQLSNGEVWLATRVGAVRLRWVDGQAACTSVVEPGGPARAVYEILEDRLGQVYLFGYDGVRRIDSHADGSGVTAPGYRVFGLHDGLPALEFNRDALLDAHGRIWAANAGGLVMYESADETPVPASPQLVLGAQLDDNALPPGASLAAEHGEISFTPRLLSFRHEHRIRYRHQLVGLDPLPGDWQADGDSRYPRIPPGDYRFQVEAMDAAGHIHGPARLDFTIVAPWWQHPLALIAAALALLAAGLLAGRFRARALAARAAQLESLVAERTQALERASNSDPLTGAWNRRYFYARIGDWLRQNEQTGGLLLLLVDIDYFKQINDQYGHATGDAVLINIATRLRRVEGEGADLIRWGGEEFLLVLRSAVPATAAKRVESVLHAVSDSPVIVDGKALSVRCSIGYTRCRPPAEGFDPHIDLVINRADSALYQAKHQGRNRAVDADAGL
ncbi:MAG TPA: diguanylate cyclase [Xanthomonadales bacterium]|nr:diguanylate cyclase [Xanthomonadales bacterium]